MSELWAVVPAAGRGMRMGAEVPKQYLPLAGKAMIAHTLERLGSHPGVTGVVVAVAADDEYFDDIAAGLPLPLVRVTGGAERCHSVLAALDHLQSECAGASHVMVHDAARPCVRAEDIDRLIEAGLRHPVGGLLAVPARDTMKRRDDHGNVLETVDRHELWHALTPQLFRLAALAQALRSVLTQGRLVTDEAQAMELTGHAPALIAGHADNIKVTEPADRRLAELFLTLQEDER